jgi:hypothetical protein
MVVTCSKRYGSNKLFSCFGYGILFRRDSCKSQGRPRDEEPKSRHESSFVRLQLVVFD